VPEAKVLLFAQMKTCLFTKPGNDEMKNILKTAAYATIALSMGFANTALAYEPGDWLIRLGATMVDPKTDNHEIVSVDSATSATINFTYMMTDIWAVEVLAAVPFKHDLKLVGGPEVGSTKQLPPTVSLQYHMMPTSQFQPYVGLGLNYTVFSDEKTSGLLEGTSLSLGSSWGLGVQFGFDVLLGENVFLNVDARYINIESKAKLDGDSIGTVKIDPMVYGAHIGFRF